MRRREQPSTELTAAEINDNDLFTGREVKRLLSQVRPDSSPYLKTEAASVLTGIPRATLKAAATRYFEMQERGERPPIRIRRTSAAKGAHWLFHEGDCFAARRERGESNISTAAPISENPGASTEQKLIDRCVRKVCASFAE